MSKTCKECKYFIGAGDWNLCCSKPPARAKDSWCGFLCYENTQACENFKEKTNMEELLERLHTELRHYGPNDTFNKGFFLTLTDKIIKELKENLKMETDYKKLYEALLEDFKTALYYAGKNNNVCNFCEKDCSEAGWCKGRDNHIHCQPVWRGVVDLEGCEKGE